jgi:hypothetical protein
MTDVMKGERVSPFACMMEAIEADKRQGHLATAKLLFGSTAEVREMPNGYAFRFPGDADVVLKAAEFISLERLCCPFLGFTLEVEPEGGEVWLQLTGRDGVKPFIRTEIGEFIGERPDIRPAP